ncbi:hypothetical protein J4G08_10425 [Candidatus Poribacteria bacterium]|nr:hypothetical protein [Candidatus Poribacteria bacterium]
MLIRFKKGKNQHKHKPDTLTCIRDDGTVTWTHIHRGFVQHDFAHYVVETTLGFQNAFFGLVAKGYNILDFNLPTSKRPFKIPKEAMKVEPIVALLQAELWESFPAPLLQPESQELPANATPAQIETMRQHLRNLLQQWDNLAPGESMDLQFVTLGEIYNGHFA